MNNPIESLEQYCIFDEDRVYVLMAIARKKENPSVTSSSEPVFREVIKDEDDIRRKVEKLESTIKNYRDDSGQQLNFRLYVNANARNTVKAYFNFRERMNGWVKDRMYGQESTARKFKQVDSHWKSELQKPESRDETRFVFDLDDVTEAEETRFVEQVRDFVDDVREVETPNGYHVVTRPFNYNDLETEVEYELKTDGMIFLRYYEAAENLEQNSSAGDGSEE